MKKLKKTKLAKKRTFRRYLQSIYFWTKFLVLVLIVTSLVITPIRNALKNQIYYYTNKMGFTLNTIIVNGVVNSSIDSRYILDIIGKKKAPIFSLDIRKIQNIISQNPWVKGSYVYVTLPSTLKIVLQEKKPLAIWQYNGKVSIIDDQGDVITNRINSQYQFLPVILGEDANINANKLFIELNKLPQLREIITHSIYVGSRRWDLIINDNLIVKMPEENFAEAYNYLISLYKENELNKITKLDLRDQKRYYRKTINENNNK